jgi:hypothetical protein
MYGNEPLRAFADERRQRLLAEAAAERLWRRPSRARRAPASLLRSAANRQDPTVLMPRVHANR